MIPDYLFPDDSLSDRKKPFCLLVVCCVFPTMPLKCDVSRDVLANLPGKYKYRKIHAHTHTPQKTRTQGGGRNCEGTACQAGGGFIRTESSGPVPSSRVFGGISNATHTAGVACLFERATCWKYDTYVHTLFPACSFSFTAVVQQYLYGIGRVGQNAAVFEEKITEVEGSNPLHVLLKRVDRHADTGTDCLSLQIILPCAFGDPLLSPSLLAAHAVLRDFPYC